MGMLRRKFGPGLITIFDPSVTIHGRILRSVSPLRSRGYSSLLNGACCLHGHFKARSFDDMWPMAKRAVWFREPHQRVISYYYHVRRVSKWFWLSGLKFLPPVLGLEMFVRMGFLKSNYGMMLDELSFESFDFIGITEDYERSLKVFSRIFEIPITDDDLTHQNVNPTKPGDHYVINERLLKAFGPYASEREVYRNARRRFELLCQDHGL